MNRRDVLRVAGVAGTLAVAGCLGDDDDEGDTTPTSEDTTPSNGDGGGSNGDESTPDESGTQTQSGDYDASTPTAAIESFVQAWQNGDVDGANELIYDDGNVAPIDVDPEQLQQVAPEIENSRVIQDNGEAAIVAVVLYTPAREETVTNQFELVLIDDNWRIGSIIDHSSTQPAVSFAFEQDGQAVEVIHEAGDAIRANTLRIRGAGVQETGTWDELADSVGPSDLVAAGDSTTVAVDTEYTVQVLWENGDQRAILGVFDGDTTEDGDSEGENGDGPPAEVDDHLSNANGYDGTIVDTTGEDSVTIETGTGQGETYQFAPPAVRIDAGTELTWEWVTDGHTVTAVSGPAELETAIEDEGFQFSHTFAEPGIVLYECEPHAAIGMLGAVVVEGTESNSGDD